MKGIVGLLVGAAGCVIVNHVIYCQQQLIGVGFWFGLIIAQAKRKGIRSVIKAKPKAQCFSAVTVSALC